MLTVVEARQDGASSPLRENKVKVVRWKDHSHTAGDGWWGSGELGDEGAWVQTTVGFVGYEDEEAIVLAMSERHGKYQRWHRIEKSLILEETEYRAVVTDAN